MTQRDEGRADDRGPGGRDLGGLGRAGRYLRALRHRGALPLRPLPVRHGRRASAARSTPGARSTRSPRARRRCGSARWSRRRASATRRCWPSWSRPPTTSPTAGSSSAWAPAGRRSSTPRTASRSCSMKERMDVLEEQLDDRPRRALRGRPVQLQRRPLHDRGPAVAPAAGPAPAPAADPGRQRRPARGAARRPLRRRVQHGHADARRGRASGARTSPRRARRPAASRSRSRS